MGAFHDVTLKHGVPPMGYSNGVPIGVPLHIF